MLNLECKAAVVLSCTDDKKYSQWIEYTTKTWKLLGIDPILVTVGFSLPSTAFYESYEIENTYNVPDSSLAQLVRLFYPTICKDYDTVIIADIDQIPLPNDYFKKYLEMSHNQSTFVGMRYVSHQYFMGWNTSPPKVWSDLMGGIESEQDVKECLAELYVNNSPSWSLDQAFLLRQLRKFNNKQTIENLNLYAIDIADSGLTKKGLFACNKPEPAVPIDDLTLLDKGKFIGAGTATAEYFNKELLEKVINHFFNESIL